MYVFNRSININIQSEDEGESVIVNGVFMDSYHEVSLTLWVDMRDFAITAAEGELRRYPHPDCIVTGNRIKNLVGLKLARGVRKKITEAVGTDAGCTHLADLALECVKALIQAKYSLMHLTLSEEEIQKQTEAYLRGSCYRFRAPGNE